jgi:hypothetical protein
MLFIISITNVVAAEDSTVQLKWKIPVENLYYFTNFGQSNGDENYFEFNIDKILDDKTFNGEVEDRIGKIKFPEESNMITVLEELSNGNIKSTAYLQNFTLPISENELTDEKAQEEAKKFEEMMNKVPQLQGVINTSGTILSFYLPQRQKNLLALMFELPKGPVKPGDTWDINFICLELGVGFTEVFADRVNIVRLTDVKKNVQLENIATLEYLLTEKVSGSMTNPMTKQTIPTEMTCSYIGRHDFNIDQGRWENINGEFRINSTGIMNSRVLQNLAMKPIEQLPEGINHKPAD